MKNILFIAAIGLLAFVSCKGKDYMTIENLETSVQNESTASAKYAAFAVKAKEEGHDTIAKLFEATSKAERIHAENFQWILNENYDIKVEKFKLEFRVGTTAENLQAAMDGERNEVATIYPQYVIDAKKDKVENAATAFNRALEGEKKHLPLFIKALESLKDSTVTMPKGYAICPVCGNIYDSISIDKNCALCKTTSGLFVGL